MDKSSRETVCVPEDERGTSSIVIVFQHTVGCGSVSVYCLKESQQVHIMVIYVILWLHIIIITVVCHCLAIVFSKFSLGF